MSESAIVRIRRPDGKEIHLLVPMEHLPRLLELANGEFGDKSIELGGPEKAVDK